MSRDVFFCLCVCVCFFLGGYVLLLLPLSSLGRWSNLTCAYHMSSFQVGWFNHQLVNLLQGWQGKLWKVRQPSTNLLENNLFFSKQLCFFRPVCLMFQVPATSNKNCFIKKQQVPPENYRKLTLTMEHPPFEDVIPVKKWGYFPISFVRFSVVYSILKEN